MGLMAKVRRLARLGGIVGVAASSLVLSYCSTTAQKLDTRIPDAKSVDVRPDSAADSSADAGPADARPDKPKPDTKLWDVMCE